MKKLFLIVAFIATLSVQYGFAQDKEGQALLSSYYDIKNALVNSDATAAAGKAGDFLKVIGGVDEKSFTGANLTAFKTYQDKLIFDARHISESKDVEHQREHFATFSANFYKLAKAVKLSGQPFYYDYCPMKKNYWLSASKDIKNPYYGKQMLTCGKVSETIQ
ncbi:DUF3347 domain-containing protein [Pedobacter hartonius]|uniref:DUF3347 domain-containing protein n=1 Tax=Pedobacter hartonius TaxID=425514 RepID=A0A1H4H9H8_9SPHI|nr:DUF3347 domain-containing protein [Pedobacter hartonius]SEB18449.1 Protein of unknown function [Pedobacter hartonius]